MTTLSCHQPCYLASLQLFAKIAKSDIFIHGSHLQFLHRSWHHRNYILLDGIRHRLSIPISRPHIKPIEDMYFASDAWKKEHLKTIALAYGNAPFFEDYYPTLKEIIYYQPYSLAMLNMELTTQLADWLGVTTPVRDLHWQVEGKDAIDKIIQMCKVVGADTFLSNTGAQAYIHLKERIRLDAAGIKSEWLRFKDPAEKKDPPEEPLSAIHHLFNLGPAAAELLR